MINNVLEENTTEKSFISENIDYNIICPVMSNGGQIIFCRKDCGVYSKILRKCSIKALAGYFYYKRR